ncbi:MAG: hypothetical protein PF505_13080 [Vallitaleaceae bacterium]|jgi:hypothetical protein|nr:hypothetical protein [Vallitaleaceae bacterium]
MFDRIRNADFVSMRQIEDLFNRFTKKQDVQARRNKLLLIIIGSVLVIGVGGFLIYKFFFAPVDEYDDFYDEFDDEYDDIDFDDDDDDEDEDEVEK